MQNVSIGGKKGHKNTQNVHRLFKSQNFISNEREQQEMIPIPTLSQMLAKVQKKDKEYNL